jgi:hypothetical protein
MSKLQRLATPKTSREKMTENNHLVRARLGNNFRTRGSPFSFLNKAESLMLHNKTFGNLASPEDIGGRQLISLAGHVLTTRSSKAGKNLGEHEYKDKKRRRRSMQIVQEEGKKS